MDRAQTPPAAGGAPQLAEIPADARRILEDGSHASGYWNAAQPTGGDAAQLAEYPDVAAKAGMLLLNNGRARDDHLHIDAPQLDAGFQDENIGLVKVLSPSSKHPRHDSFASKFPPADTPAAADVEVRSEAQGRGFVHGHAKGHSRIGDLQC